MKPALGIPVLMALISGSCARDISSRPVPGSDAPNVLIITLDTLRADVLGCYGDRDGVSPFLDEFAKSAVLFESATTAMATTFPSHSTIFTGLYPRVHCVSWYGERLAPEFTTLAERLDGVVLGSSVLADFRPAWPVQADRSSPNRRRPSLPPALIVREPPLPATCPSCSCACL